MPDVGGIAGAQLKSFVERIERLEEEKRALGEDIKEVYAEAKDLLGEPRHGFLLAHGKAFLGSAAIDASLDLEQRGDAFERLIGDRRASRNRDLVDAAPGMRPASHLGQPRPMSHRIGGVEFLE